MSILTNHDLLKKCPNMLHSIKLFTLSSNAILFSTIDDQVYAIGINLFGRLGVGDHRDRKFPEKIIEICNKPLAELHLTQWNGFALTKDGQLYMWGQSDPLIGTTSKLELKPLQMGNRVCSNIRSISVESRQLAVAMSNTKVYSWGEIVEMGYKTQKPDVLEFDKLIQQVACGNSHCMALIGGGKFFKPPLFNLRFISRCIHMGI